MNTFDIHFTHTESKTRSYIVFESKGVVKLRGERYNECMSGLCSSGNDGL